MKRKKKGEGGGACGVIHPFSLFASRITRSTSDVRIFTTRFVRPPRHVQSTGAEMWAAKMAFSFAKDQRISHFCESLRILHKPAAEFSVSMGSGVFIIPEAPVAVPVNDVKNDKLKKNLI